jgi:hypothetical protein
LIGMTERRGDQGFTVAPRSVGAERQSGRRGPRRLGVAIVLLAAIALIGVAWLGPRLANRPSFDAAFFATPTPSTTGSPSATPTLAPGRTPQITPLPAITLPDGVPQEGRLALLGDALRILDLRTGDTTVARAIGLGRDAIFREATGHGWVCVCVNDVTGSAGAEQVIRLERFGADGQPLGSTDLATVPAPTNTDFGQSALAMDVDLSPDGSWGLLATATRSGRSWEIALRRIDLVRARTGRPVVVGMIRLPTPAVTPTTPPDQPGMPTDESTLDGPHLRIAPDGRSAFLWGIAQHFAIDTVDATVQTGWRIQLETDGSVGAVDDSAGFKDMPLYCGQAGFAANDRFVWICAVEQSDPTVSGYSFRVVTIDSEGRSAGEVEFAADPDGYFAVPLFDRANGRVYVWDPVKLTMVRIDVHALTVDTVTFDAAATASPGGADHGGSLVPVWRDTDSAVQMQPFAQLAGSRDGSRIYAVAIRQVQTAGEYAQGSNGVYVIDRATLALVGHWAPISSDFAVTTLPDGRVATAALPGYDADGRTVPWGGVLTLRDPADGRILARYGQVSTDMPPILLNR